jgi:hypothetical protein
LDLRYTFPRVHSFAKPIKFLDHRDIVDRDIVEYVRTCLVTQAQTESGRRHKHHQTLHTLGNARPQKPRKHAKEGAEGAVYPNGKAESKSEKHKSSFVQLLDKQGYTKQFSSRPHAYFSCQTFAENKGKTGHGLAKADAYRVYMNI